jgi:arachidonate 15-lipoxygenase
MSVFLPNNDPAPARRTSSLDWARGQYRYNYTHVSPLAILDRVPVHDEFSFNWMTTVAEKVLVGLKNRASLEMHPVHKDYHEAQHGLLWRMIHTGSQMYGGVKYLITDALKFAGRLGAQPDRPQALADYADLFREIGLPPVAKVCGTDLGFAYMRVAGPNPLMIRRLAARDDRLPLTDKEFEAVVPGDTLDAALAEGRAFLADYAVLDGAEHGDYPHGRKYVYAPLALFVVHKETRELAPVAIQCRQKPAPDNPVFTPADGYNWLIAKTIVEMADGNVHEADSHLGRTHLFIEPFVISTFRQLAPNHPVMVLLSPHFQGTFAINQGAWQHLIAEKGAVDKLFGCSIRSSRGLAARAVRTNAVTKALLPDTLAARGVADTTALPNYPYRDDALPYWAAIGEWVGAYLRLYYHSDQDVKDDTELAAWARELAAEDGGRITGMPNGGPPATVAELTDVLTLVVFTCSVQHAAVNFPQYDLMSYIPNMPLAAYAPAPTTKTGATEADYLAMLPPLDMAELQLELGYLLGTVHYTQLGEYGDQFTDQRVSAPLDRFKDRVSAIGDAIADRNTRRAPYEHLVPTGIPQSINI